MTQTQTQTQTPYPQKTHLFFITVEHNHGPLGKPLSVGEQPLVALVARFIPVRLSCSVPVLIAAPYSPARACPIVLAAATE